MPGLIGLLRPSPWEEAETPRGKSGQEKFYSTAMGASASFRDPTDLHLGSVLEDLPRRTMQAGIRTITPPSPSEKTVTAELCNPPARANANVPRLYGFNTSAKIPLPQPHTRVAFGTVDSAVYSITNAYIGSMAIGAAVPPSQNNRLIQTKSVATGISEEDRLWKNRQRRVWIAAEAQTLVAQENIARTKARISSLPPGGSTR
jgi:hypothetical protein